MDARHYFLEVAGRPVPVRWREGADLGALAGRPVRLRFVLREADLYAFRFRAVD